MQRIESTPSLMAVAALVTTLACGGEGDSPGSSDGAPASSGTNGAASSGTSSSSGASSASGSGAGGSSASGTSSSGAGAAPGAGGSVIVDNPLMDPEEGPPAGNPEGTCDVPMEAGLADTASPDRVVGTGTAESCTGNSVIDAVAAGGVITFDCGPEPVTIELDSPAKVFNDASGEIVIDGGGLVTLSGRGTNRILYMNTCDANQVHTTEHCQNQDHPRLTIQNITFSGGNSKNETEYDGGGAVWVRGGRVKVINTRFFNNVCADTGPDVGGAGLRVLSQYEGLPVYVVNSTFGGAEGYGNACSNGGGLSSIGVSWTIINSLFSHNEATGNGGNPQEDGTPGGGSGGAIYNDGDTMTLSLCGVRIEHNQVNAYGSAIFFVSNNHDGTVRIDASVIRENTGGGWNVLPGISMHEDTEQIIDASTIE
ncbi:MAG TPA: hypothetical protein VF989_04680 [Polyangiaceae bacterium]